MLFHDRRDIFIDDIEYTKALFGRAPRAAPARALPNGGF